MLSILAISKNGDGFSLAKRLSDEGNLVKFYTEKGRIGDGFGSPQKIKDYQGAAEAADIIFFTESARGFAYDAKRFSSMGRVVMGAGGFYSVLDDPKFKEGLKMMYGVKSEEYKGRDVYVSFWFDGEGVLGLPCITTPYLRFLTGDRGVNTNGEGFVGVWTEDKDVKDEVEKVLGLLGKAMTKGFITLKFDFHEGKIKFKDAVRFNPFLLLSSLECMKFRLSDILFSLCLKGRGREMKMEYRGEVFFGLRLSSPPYPYKFKKGVEFEVKNLEQGKHMMYEGVEVKGGKIGVTGEIGTLGFVTSRGIDVREAKRRVIRTIQNLDVPSEVQFREDVGEGADEVLKKFKIKEASDAVIKRKEEPEQEHI